MPHAARTSEVRPSTASILLSFRGRIGRWQFWQFIGVEAVIILAGSTIGKLLGLPPADVDLTMALVLLYPQLAVLTKRWHDRDRSAWWLALLLIPGLGPAWTLLECGFLKGTAGPNRFGKAGLDWTPIPRRRHAPGLCADDGRPGPRRPG